MNKNIHILPTDKPSRVYRKENSFKLNTHPAIDWFISEGYKPQNIYITNDERGKHGEYVYWEKDTESPVKFQRGEYLGAKKIILTTDSDLIKDGIQAIDDEFLEWFVKNPSCEQVKVEKFEDGDCVIAGKEYINYSYEITTPETPKCLTKLEIAKNIASIGIGKEEPKQETLEEAAKEYERIHGNFKQNFIAGAKWQAKRMYNEEYMKSFGQFCADYDYRCFGKRTQEEMLQIWFEQFKKKK
jgi:hypothetical protein